MLTAADRRSVVGWAGPLVPESLYTGMHDIALLANGAQIVVASSHDEKYPPCNMIDGKPNTFWTTTGMYPQSFILALPNIANIESITIHSYNVKRLVIQKSSEVDPVKFNQFSELDLDATEGTMQRVTVGNERHVARYLCFVIESGHDNFCAIYKIEVDGSLM